MGEQCLANGRHSASTEIGFGATLNGINGKSLISGIGKKTRGTDGQKGFGERNISGEEVLPMQSLNQRRKGVCVHLCAMCSILQ